MIFPITIKRKSDQGEMVVREQLTAQQASDLYWRTFSKETGVAISIHASRKNKTSLREQAEYKYVYCHMYLKNPYEAKPPVDGEHRSIGFFPTALKAARAAAKAAGCTVRELEKK